MVTVQRVRDGYDSTKIRRKAWYVPVCDSRRKVLTLFLTILSRPVGLDFHTEAGFDFSDFFPLLNPSGIFWDVIIWFYSIYCMFI